MGFSFDDLVNQAKQAVDKGLTDLKNVGVPALQSAAEQWGANVLKQQADQLTKTNLDTQKKLDANVAEILQRPSDPNSFGAKLSDSLVKSGIAANSNMIMMGLVGVVIVGYFVFGRK